MDENHSEYLLWQNALLKSYIKASTPNKPEFEPKVTVDKAHIGDSNCKNEEYKLIAQNQETIGELITENDKLTLQRDQLHRELEVIKLKYLNAIDTENDIASALAKDNDTLDCVDDNEAVKYESLIRQSLSKDLVNLGKFGPIEVAFNTIGDMTTSQKNFVRCALFFKNNSQNSAYITTAEIIAGESVEVLVKNRISPEIHLELQPEHSVSIKLLIRPKQLAYIVPSVRLKIFKKETLVTTRILMMPLLINKFIKVLEKCDINALKNENGYEYKKSKFKFSKTKLDNVYNDIKDIIPFNKAYKMSILNDLYYEVYTRIDHTACSLYFKLLMPEEYSSQLETLFNYYIEILKIII